MAVLKEHLKPLAEDGAALTREQAAAVLEEILSGEVPEVETAALLAVLATRGEQAPELAGFVEVMRARVTPLPLTDEERNELVDTVRHRRRRSADLQHLLRRGAGGRSCRSQGGQARQSRRHLALRRGRCARGARRAHRAGPGAGRRVPARDRIHVPVCAALSPGHESRGAAAPRTRLPHHLQSLRARSPIPPERARR